MRFALVVLVFLCQFSTAPIFAQTPSFDYEVEVLDLNTNQFPLDRARTTFASENGVYFEIPGQNDQNPQLYYFDGVRTRLVYNPQQNLGSFITESIGFYEAFNDGVMFFVARQQGTTSFRYFFHRHGETEARELDLGLLVSGLSSDHVIIGDRLILRTGSRIISTDGTAAGTIILVDDNVNFSTDFVPYADGVLAFSNRSLYLTDGTAAGTNLLGEVASFPESGPVVAGDNYFYTTSEDKLYAFNLTNNVNIQLTDIDGQAQSISGPLSASSNRAVFTATTDEHGKEIWSSDGTLAGTQVFDRVPGGDSGVRGTPFSAFGKLYFRSADDQDGGIYASDGTSEGTSLLLTVAEDISSTANWSINLISSESQDAPLRIVADGGSPFTSEVFLQSSATTPLVSAGTIEGGINSTIGLAVTETGCYFMSSSDLYFLANNPATITKIGEVENFRKFLGVVDDRLVVTRSLNQFSDVDIEPYGAGPEAGSIELLGDLFPGFESSTPSSLIEYDGSLYFNAYNSTNYNALYSTDGTSSGTALAIDLFAANSSSFLGDPQVAGGRLYFRNGNNLWASNGTVETSVDLGVPSGQLVPIGERGDTVFFSPTNVGGATVFRTNGTVAGSQLIELSGNQTGSNSASQVILSNNRLYFWEYDQTVPGEITSSLVSYDLNFADRREQLVVTEPRTGNASFRKYLAPVENGLYLFRTNDAGLNELYFLDYSTGSIEFITSDAGNEALTNYNPPIYSKNRMVFIEGVNDLMTGTSTGNIITINQAGELTRLLTTNDTEGVLELFDFPGYSILATQERLIRINDDNSFEVIFEEEGLRSFTRYQNNRLIFSRPQSANTRNTWITDGTIANTELFFGIGAGYDAVNDYLGDRDYAFIPPYVATLDEAFNQPSIDVYNTVSEDFSFQYITHQFTSPGSVVAYQGKFYFEATDPLLGRELHAINFNYAKGVDITAYHDQNENGIRDEGEPGVQNIGFSAASSTYETRAFTDENGLAELVLEADSTFAVSSGTATCWELISPPASNELTFRTGEQQELAYGFRLTGDAPGLNLLLSSARPRCGFTVPFWLTVQNTGCTMLTGQASITLPDDVQFVSAEETPLVEGQTVSWPYADLPPNGIHQFKLFLTMPNEESNGMVIPIDAGVFALDAQNDTITQGDFDYRQVLSCAIDPNDKQVLPVRVEPSNSNYTQVDEIMTFTIRFQNTGTDTAFTVLIADELPRELDATTFKPLTASHPYVSSINGSDVEFLFEDIMLPDSNTNEMLSHGFVTFEILPNPEVAIGRNVRNRASIYFDYNSAIITNRTRSAIVEFLDEDLDGFLFYEDCDDKNPNANPNGFDIAGNGIDEDCDGEDSPVSTRNPLSGTLRVSPNPTAGILNLNFSDQRQLEARLYNLLGKEIQRIGFRVNSSLDLTVLPAGVYLLSVTDAATGEATTRRIIKD